MKDPVYDYLRLSRHPEPEPVAEGSSIASRKHRKMAGDLKKGDHVKGQGVVKHVSKSKGEVTITFDDDYKETLPAGKEVGVS